MVAALTYRSFHNRYIRNIIIHGNLYVFNDKLTSSNNYTVTIQFDCLVTIIWCLQTKCTHIHSASWCSMDMLPHMSELLFFFAIMQSLLTKEKEVKRKPHVDKVGYC